MSEGNLEGLERTDTPFPSSDGEEGAAADAVPAPAPASDAVEMETKDPEAGAAPVEVSEVPVVPVEVPVQPGWRKRILNFIERILPSGEQDATAIAGEALANVAKRSGLVRRVCFFLSCGMCRRGGNATQEINPVDPVVDPVVDAASAQPPAVLEVNSVATVSVGEEVNITPLSSVSTEGNDGPSSEFGDADAATRVERDQSLSLLN